MTLLTIATIGFCQQVNNPDFDAKLQKELKHDVPEIDINTVVLMQDFILLDARSIEEYNVSHIEGAKHVDFVNFDISKLGRISKKDVIVVYCSVGSRSERVTRILIESGYKQSFNLYGGIFEWSNRELAMVNPKGEETTQIHGVTLDWAKWIDKGIIVF